LKINSLPREIYTSCIDFGLLDFDEKFKSIKITDGVSSDIWYVKSKLREFCVKRALAKLTVKEDWFAPVNRSNFEAEYFKTCKNINKLAFPKILGHDKKKYILAMNWYNKDQYKLWKSSLLKKYIETKDGKRVAEILVKKHAHFFNKKAIKDKFSNDKTFHAIRIEPYILFTSNSYPQYKKLFDKNIDNLSKNKKTLIHGDFSPKNILIGKDSPVILDAETACWGDPVFDLAFCNNHIILKSILNFEIKDKYISLSKCFLDTYISFLNWENKDEFIERFLSLVPIFILARLDGKSPVEYFQKGHIERSRGLAKKLIENNVKTLSHYFQTWNDCFE